MNKIKIGWCEESIVPEGRKVDLVGQFYERISDKVETPIAVNALAIECGDDAVIFCACDLVSTSHSLLVDVRAALPESFPKDKLIISAIHTHTSIGYSRRGDSIAPAALHGLKEFLPEEYIYKPLVTDNSPEVMRGDEARAFLDDVYNYEGISPIYSANGEVDFEMLHYWYFNEAYEQAPSTFSLFGGFYTASSTPAETLVYRNVFTLPVYTEALETKVYYENTADYITNDASAPSAARVVKGTASDKAALEAQGYTVLTVAAPRIADEDVFDSMFAIGAITRDKSRNLEIIAMLNTEPEIRNLLQYGIEGVNYTLKTVHDAQGNELGVYAEMKADNAYVMDIAKTGNMFVAYPNAATSDFANGQYGIGAWDDAKKQNLDATLYPTLGLNFSPDYELDVNGVRMMSAVSAQFNVMVMANITSTERVAELRDGAIAASAAGYEAMAGWILGLTGPVTYVPVGEKNYVVITVEALAEVLEKMDSSYNDSVEYGAVLSPKALYEEWWLRNYGADANQ